MEAQVEVIRAKAHRKAIEESIRENGIREGTVMEDALGTFVVTKILEHGSIKIWRTRGKAMSISVVVEDKQSRTFSPRTDFVLIGQPPSGHVFFRCVRKDGDHRVSKELQHFIRKFITAEFIEDTPYGAYWDEEEVHRLTAEFVNQTSVEHHA